MLLYVHIGAGRGASARELKSCLARMTVRFAGKCSRWEMPGFFFWLVNCSSISLGIRTCLPSPLYHQVRLVGIPAIPIAATAARPHMHTHTRGGKREEKHHWKTGGGGNARAHFTFGSGSSPSTHLFPLSPLSVNLSSVAVRRFKCRFWRLL